MTLTPQISKEAQAIPTFLMTQMIQIAFDTLEDRDFSASVAYSYLAEELSKALSRQGVNETLEKNIQTLLQVQETSHDTKRPD